MPKKFSLVTQVGLVSLVFFVIFALFLSKVVTTIVTKNFVDQTEDSITSLLENQVDNFLNATNFEHKIREDEEIKSDHAVFGPFFETITTDDTVKMRIWDSMATIIHTHTKGNIDIGDINKSFPDNEEYWAAMNGEVSVETGNEADLSEEGLGEIEEIMEVYVPVYLTGQETPVGVVEVYYDLAALNATIASINKSVFAFTGATFVILYLILLGITKRASDTIKKQNKMIEKAHEGQIKKQKEMNDILRLLNKNLRHDILNDLTVVMGNIDNYLEYGEEKLKVKDVLSEAQESMDNAVEFIGRMKDLENALVTGQPLGEVDVKEAVDEAKEGFNVKVSVKGNASIKADGAFISVIQNLIRNAVVHGKAKKITIMTKKNGNEAEISLADNGKGIPKEIRAKLFEEGFKFGETGNTGLGLYIVKKTIERYGGSVAVSDNKPKGAKFVLTLPLIETSEIKTN